MARRGVHKVGLAAAAVGLPCLLMLPFATLRASRIDTGDGVGLFAAAGAVPAMALLVAWLVVVALSARNVRSAWYAGARGLAAGASIVGIVAVSEVAARNLLATAGAYARVSIGGGAWAAMAAAYMVVVAGRREAAAVRPLSLAVQALVPAGIAALLLTGSLGDLGIVREYVNWSDRFWAEVGNHLVYTGAAVGIALVLGLAIGIAAFSWTKIERPLLAGVSLLQTIPGLAMIGILVGPLSALANAVPVLKDLGIGGLGWAPVVIALTLYALLVVVHDVVVGLRGVSPDAVDAARGMGMTGVQMMRRVRLPLASPVIYTGARTASLQTVGNATLGAFAAAGTLGLFITQGLAEGSSDLVLLGAITLVALALVLDAVLRLVEPLVVPAVRRLRLGRAASR
jgi:osmoprotectant transport system permease protein